MEKVINLMIIGIGPHAQKSYLPTLYRHQEEWGLKLKLGIDLINKTDQIKKYLTQHGFDLPLLFLDPFPCPKKLPKAVDACLTQFIQENNIHGVIISTEPLVHKVYAEWALKRGLHILMDKPISTRENVITDWKQAKGIHRDYVELQQLYQKLQNKKPTIFSVNVQRRYHVGHRQVISLIKEVAEEFDAPVTCIHSTHADGQWRMPNEIVDQIYHPYCQGYGKCSHSGYHLFDIAYQYYRAGYRVNKSADEAQGIASFVRPRGFLKQFNQKNYVNYFGETYSQIKKRDDAALYALYEQYGEMDAAILFRLMREQENICHLSINLLHNSFARRTWVHPGKDLYKGNGRVKHEYHMIQQGPFQCIQVHSYQSKDKHDYNTAEDYLVGGNNHFDIYVFRNQGMFKNPQKAFITYQLKDLDLQQSYNASTLAYENAKEFVVLEFINFIRRKVNRDQLLSDFASHAVPVRMMSAVYCSHIQQARNKSPLVKFPIAEGE